MSTDNAGKDQGITESMENDFQKQNEIEEPDTLKEEIEEDIMMIGEVLNA